MSFFVIHKDIIDPTDVPVPVSTRSGRTVRRSAYLNDFSF